MSRLYTFALIMTVALASTPVQSQLSYPKTKKIDHYENFHGQKVYDPYQWLEDDRSAETEAWVTEQNKLTFDYLSKIPYRDGFKKRITELNNYPKYSSPFRVGQYYFFSKNDGLQNQSVYYYQVGLDGEAKVFLDPNKMSTDGTVSANISGKSNDDKYLSINVSKSGSDWQEINIMEVATGKTLKDKVEWVKFSGASFYKDGFFYSRYDEPKKGTEFSGKNEFHKVYYHKIGTKQSEDKLVLMFKDHPQRYISTSITDDERYQIISVSQGTGGNMVMVKDLTKNPNVDDMSGLVTIVDDFNNENGIIDNMGDKLLMLTDRGAPKNRLVVIDLNNPKESNWKDLIPEKKDLLQSVSKAGGKLFANYLQDVATHIYQLDLTGKLEKEIQLPSIGSAGGFGGKDEDKTLFYSFTSFNYPPTIFKYDVATGNSEMFRKPEIKFNPADYEVKQVFYPSKDGTKVPMFIVHKKGLILNGNNPTLLYGYGGFNISLSPSFSPSRISMLEQGAVYVQANLRGGGEYGEAWHQAGTKMNKQNVFDDFISAAEWLIDNKYTSSEKLAIQGGSNGGLLVGACMAQRPDLFKVCFPAVGVMDMLKFHRFTIGWGWIDDYGSPEEPAMFEYLKGYSPLHNLKDGTKYPSTIVTTADHDDRVVPAHSFKFAARLQEAHKGDNPVLIRVETKSGHGAGKSLTKAIDEIADLYSFMFYNMGVTPKF